MASYTTWKSLDRQVRRGEKALRVMAPIIRRAVVSDDHGQPVPGPDGRKQLKQQVVGFRPAPVFDVNQTDGPPLPEPERPVLLAGKAPVGLWDALVREVSERGYRLMRGSVTDLGGANGVTRIVEREVWVRNDVDNAQATKTLAHELAHVMLHAQPDAGSNHVDCAGMREVEAESVAHLVMAAHHLDTGTYSFPYVATWAYPLAAVEHVPMNDIVTRTGNRVIKASSEIINATTPVISNTPKPATRALTARVSASAQQAADLRDQVAVTALPPVDRAVLLAVVADSQDFFRRQVESSWVANYLTERRLAEAIRSHQLGYAPKRWTTLTHHLRGLGYTDDHIEAAGMATRARNGHLIDRFRDRLTIPLRDHQGDLVGFTARLGAHHSEGRNGSKYLNSPTTTVFHKSELLYGLGDHHAKLASGHLPVLCEGPLDAITIDLLTAETATQLVGIAVSGTAFSDHHARHLLDAAGNNPICLAFDADPAGQAATEAVWLKLTDSAPHEVVVPDLPAGSDPASLFSADPQVLAHHLHSAQPAAQVIAGRQVEGAGLNGNCLRELTAFRDLISLAERMPAWQRTGYLLSLAERLHIEPAAAAAEVAERNPSLLLDRALNHCRQLDDVMGTAVPQREMVAVSESASDSTVSLTNPRSDHPMTKGT